MDQGYPSTMGFVMSPGELALGLPPLGTFTGAGADVSGLLSGSDSELLQANGQAAIANPESSQGLHLT